MLKLGRGSRKIAQSLENHLEIWKEKEDFKSKYSLIVDYVLNVLKLAVSEDDILKIITSSYTNDFSFILPNGNQVRTEARTCSAQTPTQVQVMFPLTAMMNHSCRPSIYRSIYQTEQGAFKMSVRAARSLKAGEQIFNSYIDILDPVTVRQRLLLETKHMTCR